MTDTWAISGVPVQIRRSPRRRTVGLQVRPGEITLYAPARVPLVTLREIVDARRDWIAHHLEQYAARPMSPWIFEDGGTLLYLGETLNLKMVPDLRFARREGGDLLIPPGSSADTARRVERWTRRVCLPPYQQLVLGAAARLNATAKLGRVQISGAQYRWGSCNAQGDIRLHWKLSRAPLDVLDYVAVHEAAHLLEFNHSRRYWALVEQVLPGYRRQRDWLKEYGHTL
ncbi:M48 family metallopeptidase [Deinococcus sp. KSM4-11]|uniref:M48 family metallopeptidase n=1 Tax=Deinococcus sp. KSM4-11 TaxID=2568654 RepID=UPI0010A3AEDF|nr:SprT family zinc-dependent metalloprotease [Deinococcus sp. KSM4-11]THF83923.1 M48 family metallopeptidase [Deinococcus sp. KSM4-11]